VNTDQVKLGEIGQIAVPVRDLERAITFYRDTLGIPFLFQVPHMAFFDCAGVRLMLGMEEDPSSDRGSSILYFRVPDIFAYTQSLRARGVAFAGDPELVAEMPEYDLYMSFFQDTEGNTMALMSEVRPTSEGRPQPAG
jgi:predicted enzyme related to lactoylglutathione lyase